MKSKNELTDEIKEKIDSSATNRRFGIYTIVVAVIAICIFLLFMILLF